MPEYKKVAEDPIELLQKSRLSDETLTHWIDIGMKSTGLTPVDWEAIRNRDVPAIFEDADLHRPLYQEKPDD